MNGSAESASVQIDPALIDRMLDLYCDWRTECEAVRSAYARFANAPASERALAFAAYAAAVDREASASNAYEGQIRLVRAGLPASSPTRGSEPSRSVCAPDWSGG